MDGRALDIGSPQPFGLSVVGDQERVSTSVNALERQKDVGIVGDAESPLPDGQQSLALPPLNCNQPALLEANRDLDPAAFERSCVA